MINGETSGPNTDDLMKVYKELVAHKEFNDIYYSIDLGTLETFVYAKSICKIYFGIEEVMNQMTLCTQNTIVSKIISSFMAVSSVEINMAIVDAYSNVFF